jgi:DHA1 family tetracycline resistance protein-like MFS transporter
MSTKKTLPILVFTILLDMIGVGMIIPIIPIIFTDPTSPSFLLQGFSHQLQFIIAGFITALSGIMTFIFAPILGELSDLYGRKKLLAICIAILAVSQIVFGLGILLSSLTILFIARAVAGIAGANISIAQASIADVTEPQNRAKNFGLIGVAVGIGFIVGPALGGAVASLTHSASVPFFVSGVLGIINLISITFYLPETRKVPESKLHNITIFKAIHNIRSAFTGKETSHLYISNFLYLTGFTFFTASTGIFLVQKFGLTSAGLGTYFGVLGVWIVITQGFILRVITKKYTEKAILRFSLVAVALAIIAMPFMPTLVFIYVILPFIAIPQGLSMANMSALISKSVSPEKQGAAMGINGSLAALAQGAVPALAGGVTALFGISFPYFVAGTCMLLAWRNLILRKVSA